MKYRIFLNKIVTEEFLGWYETDSALQKGEIISLRRVIKNSISTNKDIFWRVKESVRQVRLIDNDTDTRPILLFEETFEANLIVEEVPKEEIKRLLS